MKIFKKMALVALTAVALISCTEKEDVANPTFSIKLDHSANIGDVLYDGDGNGFTLTTLKYFVTDVVLHKSNGDKVAIDNEIGATIVDLANAAEGGAIVYNDIVGVEKGSYTSVSFKVGVSEDIYSQGESAQGRILELANTKDANDSNMIWGWTTGYVFTKIEGTLTGTTGTNEAGDDDDHTHRVENTDAVAHNGTDHEVEGTEFIRHAGNIGTESEGTRTNRVKEVTLSFNGQEVVLGNVDSSIHLKVDVAAILDGTNKINVKDTPGNMMLSADEVSENVADSFSFDHKH